MVTVHLLHTKPPEETSVLVTGARGFIAGHLIRALIDRRYNVTHSLDIATHVDQDINTAPLPRDVDWCIHLAAQTDAQSADYAVMDLVNRKGTERLLEFYGHRLIFASTCAVNWIDHPGLPYAETKLAAERMCRVHRARVVRLCNIFGPGGHSVIDRFASSDVLSIRGAGTQLRTYAHVNHAVIALIRQMNKPAGNVYTLPGANLTVNEIAEFWPQKPRRHVDKSALDVEHAPQVYPLLNTSDES